jgi:MYXO-CTERM domain-containing protein
MTSVKVAAVVALLSASAAQAVVVGVESSSAPWLGFMNVFNLPSNGGAFQFASGWGVPDLRATFNDPAQEVSMLPNTIGDTNEYWYIGQGTNPGGPGAPGNKIMEANLFQQRSDGSLSGTTVTFNGFVTANTLTSAHEARIFIRDFAPDFSSFNETIISAPASGAFSLSLNTLPGAGRNVQWGMQLKGVNVWATDTAPFGSITYSSVPGPGALALAGVLGLAATRRRRA